MHHQTCSHRFFRKVDFNEITNDKKTNEAENLNQIPPSTENHCDFSKAYHANFQANKLVSHWFDQPIEKIMQIEQVEDSLKSAADLFSTAYKYHRTDKSYQNNLSRTYEMLGDFYHEKLQWALAIKNYQNSQALLNSEGIQQKIKLNQRLKESVAVYQDVCLENTLLSFAEYTEENHRFNNTIFLKLNVPEKKCSDVLYKLKESVNDLSNFSAMVYQTYKTISHKEKKFKEFNGLYETYTKNKSTLNKLILDFNQNFPKFSLKTIDEVDNLIDIKIDKEAEKITKEEKLFLAQTKLLTQAKEKYLVAKRALYTYCQSTMAIKNLTDYYNTSDQLLPLSLIKLYASSVLATVYVFTQNDHNVVYNAKLSYIPDKPKAILYLLQKKECSNQLCYLEKFKEKPPLKNLSFTQPKIAPG